LHTNTSLSAGTYIVHFWTMHLQQSVFEDFPQRIKSKSVLLPSWS